MHYVRIGLILAIPVVAAAVALLALFISDDTSSTPAVAGDPSLEGFDGLYAGMHTGGGNVVVKIDVTSLDPDAGVADLRAEKVPLDPEDCPGDVITVTLSDEELFNPGTLYRFEAPEAFGVLQHDFADGEPKVGGSIAAGPISSRIIAGGPEPGECFNTVSYEAEKDAVQQGDVDCSWSDGIDEVILRSSTAGVDENAIDGVTAVDSLRILQVVAGIDPPDNDETCPDVGEETPGGNIIGDVDCDGDADAVDALGDLLHVAALPELTQNEPCPDIGIFYSPDL